MMIGWRNAWSMKLRVQGQEEDQRGPGERLSERIVKLVNWTKRMPWIVVSEEDDKGCPMIRMGVSGWMFLLVPAYPCSPGHKAVKRLCVCVCACVRACVCIFACLLLLCLIYFCSTKTRDQLERTSKWPILCWVGFKTLTQSVLLSCIFRSYMPSAIGQQHC